MTREELENLRDTFYHYENLYKNIESLEDTIGRIKRLSENWDCFLNIEGVNSWHIPEELQKDIAREVKKLIIDKLEDHLLE